VIGVRSSVTADGSERTFLSIEFSHRYLQQDREEERGVGCNLLNMLPKINSTGNDNKMDRSHWTGELGLTFFASLVCVFPLSPRSRLNEWQIPTLKQSTGTGPGPGTDTDTGR